MATAPSPLKLDRGDFSGAPAWVEDLFNQLNPEFSSIQTVLAKGVTLSDNVNATVVNIQVVAPDIVWNEIGTQGVPGFVNSWSNQGAAYETAAFRIDSDGFVCLKGWVTGGSPPSIVWTMPSGFIPTLAQGGATVANGAFGAWVVHETGAVEVNVGSGTSVSLCNIRYKAGSPCGAPLANKGTGWPVSVTHNLTKVSGICVLRCLDTTAGDPIKVTVGSLGVSDWSNAAGATTLTLKSIPGLSPGRKYTITLLVWA